jgi:hypothetical protein
MSGWLRSERAGTLFWYSAWIVVCLGIFLAFMATPWLRQIDSFRGVDPLLRVLGAILGIAGGAAALVLLFGMLVFCARAKTNRPSAKSSCRFSSFSQLPHSAQPCTSLSCTESGCAALLGLYENF